jgi:hypothetical protein
VLKQIWILVRDKVRDKDFTYFAKVWEIKDKESSAALAVEVAREGGRLG